MIFDYTEASEIYTTFINVDIENIPTCDSNAAINFTLKCPEGYQGCLTKIYGNKVKFEFIFICLFKIWGKKLIYNFNF